MSAEEKKYWFPARADGFGWGWGMPITWQGWVVYIAFLVLIIAGSLVMVPYGVLAVLVWASMLSALLISICFWKGEPPGSCG